MKKELEGCACGSQQDYQQCCYVWHQGQKPATAEQLMRSRYVAYVMGDIQYLVSTTHPAQQNQLDQSTMLLWSQQTVWQGLAIHWNKTLSQPPAIERAIVAFTAKGVEQGQEFSHYEESLFVKADHQQWFFIDPHIRLNLSRNQSCSCGSGKKYKQCCLKTLG